MISSNGERFEPTALRRYMDITIVLGSKSDMPVAEKAAKIVAERVAANWIDPRARVERVLPKFMQRLSRKKKI